MKVKDSPQLDGSAPVGMPSFKLNGYLIVPVALVAAVLLRQLIDPWVRDRVPFLTFFLATIIVAWSCRTGVALLTLVFSWLLADWFFLDPRYHLEFPRGANLFSSISYLISGLATILFSGLMHRARDRADRNAAAAILNQRLLEKEVADRKRIEEEVRLLNASLEQRVSDRTAELVNLNQELESFTYSVSHDLRAPLRHMDGYAQILEQELGPTASPETKKCLNKVRQGSQKMSLLVDDLLELSRIGKQELARRPVDLNALVSEVISEVQTEAGERKVEWRVGPLPTIPCDPGLIRVAFTNLLSNALKYTRPREAALIEVDEVSQAGETIIRIRDNGVGFDMKFSEKLFGVFQRLHRPSEFEGSGVGLATVLRIVRRHGGRVWAEAEVGKGASFYLALAGRPPSDQEGQKAA